MTPRSRDATRLGLIGSTLVAAATLAAVNVPALPYLSAGATYSGRFLDAGGLETGASVEMAGVTVGTVTGIEVDGDAVLVRFTMTDVAAGADSRLSIATETVLGTKSLRVESRGDGRLSTSAPVALDRTTSPYVLTDALGDLTDDAAGIDVDRLTDAMAATTDVLQRTPDSVGRVLDGVGRLSRTLASRDEALRDLLSSAERVTAVLAERSGTLDALLQDAAVVLAALDERRSVVDTLAGNVTRLSDRLRALVAENENELAPALDDLQSVLSVLSGQRDAIAAAITELGPYVTQLGEAVSSGPFFDSYIQNLIPGQIISPVLRATLGLPAAPGDSASVNPLSALNGAPR
ncbi:MCE family protein [Rhodococcoides corynebacterioides]|uniref:MCE family protein n=1 Tax=Rhodococcoides corynebacterioides TaxID=53972 RepID=UPI003ADD393E